MLRRLWKRPRKSSSTAPGTSDPAAASDSLEALLDANLHFIRKTVGNSSDIVIREVVIGVDGMLRAAIIYTDGLAESKHVLEALMLDARVARLDGNDTLEKDPMRVLMDSTLAIGETEKVHTFDGLFHAVLSGDIAILLDGQAAALIANGRNWKERNVSEPASQSVIRGPREGFTESIRTNTALIRRKIKDPRLWLEMRLIGRITRTDVGIMYIQGIVNEQVLKEVKQRLDGLDIDSVLESGTIEELIEDKVLTPFPTMINTERPDSVAASLLEGRVAILVDGTPFVLVVPALFSQFYISSEDYYQRADFATLIRILRYLSLFITLLAPSLYVAVTTFHHELLPTQLLIGLAAQREGVPFPAFVEAVLMEITFEILREAGVRMPKTIGQSVSIVGTLVIGQAAVEAGLVSPAMVIVVSITAISNFAIPSFNMGISLRLLRFVLMGLSASFGLYGITIGLIAIVLHLCQLKSFGIPYLSPFAPLQLEEQKDTIFRMPMRSMFSRKQGKSADRQR
ncbi:spore germination protein [Paenibacillus sp. GD4]|uniref:spore germination protein n=1 Tax=Paenibacillus sp. GD4 TaxID=3068890 RepID=UPI002796678E|nr:spore germination protein [Paenibacillus sp. GD4]MDQ1913934.1 spore germination protein [Paenibacillus sp. GD4]